MVLILELILAALGAVAAVIAINEFLIKNTTPPDLPSLGTEIRKDDDHVVLSVSKNDRENPNSLSYAVYEFVRAYNPADEDEFFFIHNPKGFYLVSRGHYFQSVMLGTFLVVSGLLYMLLVAALGAAEKMLAWQLILFVVFCLSLAVTGVFFLGKSRKHFRRSRVAKEYIEFLNSHKIYVGVYMVQRKSEHGKHFGN